jgi:Protein of unknown function (DUF3147)
MSIQVSLRGLKKTKLWELALRFVFGGMITVGTGTVAQAYGPVVAGLFLAFPAILPASLTLVWRHDGRRDASMDAKGAAVGSLGLAAFGTAIWLTAGNEAPAPTLLLAALSWAFVSVGVWWLIFGSSR